MQHINIITRRGFMERSMKIGLGVALSTLTDIPFVMKRALAEGQMGLNGKKLLFIFLRGANDSLNSLIPIQDPAYNANNRPHILIPRNPTPEHYSTATPDGTMDDFTLDAGYPAEAIRAGNGFAALHPSLKYLARVYNAGDLALVHRVGYPKQSRSHFDSQIYWENGTPNNNLAKDGIFYRTIVESGLAAVNPLTGVSIQSALPLILRGSAAAMTNLSDPTRFNLLGIPNTTSGNTKADNAIVSANTYPFPAKLNRELLANHYSNLKKALDEFSQGIDFTNNGNVFIDPDTGYHLFPTNNAKNGGGVSASYIVDTGAYGFFTSLKAAALILNKTDAIIAGTELGGFDTHNNQVVNNPTLGTFDPLAGTHSNLQKRIGWAIYGLRKYFMNHGDRATWNNLVVVTLSEFGRTTIQNGTYGTDHAEGGAMFVAGGGVQGLNKGTPHSGIFGCHTTDVYNGWTLNWVPGGETGTTGSMFGVSTRYLKRIVDYRSVLGEIIRDHLGATQNQLNRIIPGYTDTREKLQAGGLCTIDNTTIAGELGLV